MKNSKLRSAYPGAKLASASLMALLLGTTHTFAAGIDVAGDGAKITVTDPIDGEESTGILLEGSSAEIINESTITSDGSIAVFVEGGSNQLVNRGEIRASGEAVKVEGTGNTIINYGRLTSDRDAVFLYDGGNTAINRGTITGLNGLSATDGGNRLENHGIIDVTGDGIYSGSFEAPDVVVNTGTIKAVRGLNLLGDEARAHNSGRIEAEHGVVLGGYNNEFRNSGVIRATDSGIYDDSFQAGENIIVNSGKILVENHATNYAIDLESNGNTVVLQEGSVLAGKVRISGNGNTLRLGKGFSGALTVELGSSGLPVVNSGQRVFAVDDTFYAFDTSELGAVTSSASGLTYDLTRGLFADIAGRTSALRACADQASCKAGFWANSSVQASAERDSDERDALIAAQSFGYDKAINQGKAVGFFGGYALSSATAGDRAELEQNSGYLGAYYSLSHGGLFSDLALISGYNWTDVEREFANNTKADGIETLKGNTTSYYVSPGVTVGYDAHVGNLKLTPSVQARFTHFAGQGYSEKGSSGLKYSDLDGQQLDVRTQLKAALFTQNENRSWNVNLRSGVDVFRNWGGKTEASFNGESFSISSTREEKGARAFVGADASVNLSNSFALKADAEAGLDTEEVLSGKMSVSGSLSF